MPAEGGQSGSCCSRGFRDYSARQHSGQEQGGLSQALVLENILGHDNDKTAYSLEQLEQDMGIQKQPCSLPSMEDEAHREIHERSHIIGTFSCYR